VPCRYAEVSADGTASLLGGGIDSVWPPELPATVALFLMLRLAGAEDEFQEETELEVRVVDPARDETQALALSLSQQEVSPLKVPGMEAGALFPAVIHREAGDYGLYTLEVFLGGRRQRSIPISVRDPAELQDQNTGS
jgi:hypothetical protein